MTRDNPPPPNEEVVVRDQFGNIVFRSRVAWPNASQRLTDSGPEPEWGVRQCRDHWEARARIAALREP